MVSNAFVASAALRFQGLTNLPKLFFFAPSHHRISHHHKFADGVMESSSSPSSSRRGVDQPSECSRIDYVAKRLEEKSSASSQSGVPSITAVQDDNGGGILTRASKKLRRGDCALRCCAAGVAIDSQFRSSRCAYCAEACQNGALCSECGVVGVCERCKSSGADKWHSSSGECRALRALVSAFSIVFGLIGEDGGAAASAGANNNIADLAKEIDSSYIITVRLIHRRWFDGENSRDDSSIFPSIDWRLFDSLHKTKVTSEQYDIAIAAICEKMNENIMSSSTVNDTDTSRRTSGSNGFVITKEAFDDVLERVVGCGHAVVDLTLGLGSQAIGRAIFLEHSFYNHSCSPNAFISCQIGNADGTISTGVIASSKKSCALVASVHCLGDISSGNDVCLSYIPTSGLSRRERQQLLQDGYHFQCRCRACRLDEGDATAKEWDRCLAVPERSDLDSLREVQYGVNHTFVESSDRDEIERSIGLVRMVGNGVKNQGIAASHECAMEVHRLLSVGYATLNHFDDAIREHKAFFSSVEKIAGLFDPVALATQHTEFALVLHRNGDVEGERSELKAARLLATTALGQDHPYATAIERKLQALGKVSVGDGGTCSADQPNAKRQKTETEDNND